jgi:hypothetical protein
MGNFSEETQVNNAPISSILSLDSIIWDVYFNLTLLEFRLQPWQK